jgi:hypothetical protein
MAVKREWELKDTAQAVFKKLLIAIQATALGCSPFFQRFQFADLG